MISAIKNRIERSAASKFFDEAAIAMWNDGP
jgi:hypothetical protein